MPQLPLCFQFARRSEHVKNWIGRQSEVKEESITDWLLDELSNNIPGMLYKQFNRHEEAKITGADWEWWFVFPHNHFFSMRVQAKKIHLGDNYADIARSNRYGLQIEKLIDNAKPNNFFPLYAFYSEKASDKCCITTRMNEGVFLASADAIRHKFIVNGKSKVEHNDILSLCIPLSKFVCARCVAEIQIRDGSSKSKTVLYFEMLFRRILVGLLNMSSDLESNIENIVGFRKGAPLYVSNMLDKGIENMDDQIMPLCEKVLVTDMRNMENLFLFI